MIRMSKQISNPLVNTLLQNQSQKVDNVSQEVPVEGLLKKKKFFKKLTPEQKAKREAFKQTLTWLCETFLSCFNLSAPKPLKKGIVADIFSHLPKDHSISRRSIRLVLAFYTRRKVYHKAVMENTHRFNLEGLEVEEILLKEKDYAKTALEIREAKKRACQAKKVQKK